MRSTERYSRSNAAPDVARWVVSAIARVGLASETPRPTYAELPQKQKPMADPPQLATSKAMPKGPFAGEWGQGRLMWWACCVC